MARKVSRTGTRTRSYQTDAFREVMHICQKGLRQAVLGGELLMQLPPDKLEGAYWHILDRVARFAGCVTTGEETIMAQEMKILRPLSGAIVRLIDRKSPESDPPRSKILANEAYARYGDRVEQLGEWFDFEGRHSGILLDNPGA